MTNEEKGITIYPSEKKKRIVVVGETMSAEIIATLNALDQMEVVAMNTPPEKAEIKARLDELVKKEMYKPAKIPEFKNYKEKFLATRKHRCR